jgi:hypothetical protein
MADLRSEGYGNSPRSDAADQPDAAEDLRNVTSLAGVIRNAPLGSFAAYAPLLPGTGGAGQQLVATPKSDPQADQAAAASLSKLVAGNQVARELNEKAITVLVFPKIVKVGFILGDAYGEGVLRQGDQTVG